MLSHHLLTHTNYFIRTSKSSHRTRPIQKKRYLLKYTPLRSICKDMAQITNCCSTVAKSHENHFIPFENPKSSLLEFLAIGLLVMSVVVLWLLSVMMLKLDDFF
eukprot:TRINITY_DN2041_c0_g1_i2.p1 TRINITY_DN2041_c0_g1~~TRINITY_DN2041_c0_g1_i2.p1  ORF type:complete len:104 (-),score=7.90 TRINITY_DN2041_c0_g1_i2:322-633(-)